MPETRDTSSPAPGPIRLLIVDDHDILRYGLRALLRKHHEVEVVGEADSVADSIEKARALAPDVVLMDARLPDGSGIDACREILSANPKIRVLFFSAESDGDTVISTLLAGAQGYVPKDAALASLLEAIATVAGGGTVIDESFRAQLLGILESVPGEAAAPPRSDRDLSPQEERVMALVVQGKTNKEIAAALALSDKTVKNYLYNAFQKLGVGRRAHAASLFDLQRLRQAQRKVDG